jgi:hypothetical protein
MQHFEENVDVKKISSTLKAVLRWGRDVKKREYISEDC